MCIVYFFFACLSVGTVGDHRGWSDFVGCYSVLCTLRSTHIRIRSTMCLRRAVSTQIRHLINILQLVCYRPKMRGMFETVNKCSALKHSKAFLHKIYRGVNSCFRPLPLNNPITDNILIGRPPSIKEQWIPERCGEIHCKGLLSRSILLVYHRTQIFGSICSCSWSHPKHSSWWYECREALQRKT